jgi:site-specific recombinase XerD
MAYRHGLRVSELCDLQWNQIDFTTGVIHVRRRKGSVPSTHPLTGREMRALRKLQREGDKNPFVFVNERKEPLSPAGFARMLQRATGKAGLGIKVHPHNLRHACGYKLANDGVDTRSLQAWLGHKNIEHTVCYSELSPTRFRDFWRD